MKKIFNYILPLAMSFSLASCDDFLDLKQQGTENSENYFNQINNAIAAVNGVYDILAFDEGSDADGQWRAGHFDFMVGDIISDDAERGSHDGENTDLLKFAGGQIETTNEKVTAFWIHGYWGISRANFVLEGLENVTWSPSMRDRIRGEALFLRAYYHWYLVRMFGPIMVFTESVQPSDFGKVQRQPVGVVYAQIAKDLKEAAELLPERSEYAVTDMGRATKGAANALLARVYMFQIGTDELNTTVKWSDVYDATNKVISSGQYKLLDNYAMLWETENDNSIEGVFEIQTGEGAEEYAPGSIGSNLYQYCGNRDEGLWGHNNPTKNLFDAFEEGDPRLSSTVYGPEFNEGILYGERKTLSRDQMGSNWLCRKLALPAIPSPARAGNKNIKVIRYADVLLMHAEAAYHLGNEDVAREKVNEVRARARKSTYCKGYTEGKNDYSAAPENNPTLLPDVTTSGNELFEAICHERRVELAMESLRFFDLIRWGKLIENMGYEKETARQSGGSYDGFYSENVNMYYRNISTNLSNCSYKGAGSNRIFVLPIPQSEVQAYGVKQNDGY